MSVADRAREARPFSDKEQVLRTPAPAERSYGRVVSGMALIANVSQ